MTTVVKEISNILEEAYGRPYTEAETIEIIKGAAQRIAAEREKRTRFPYTPEQLAEANRLHNEQGLSIHQIAVRLGCDRKTLKAKMVEANYEVRGQKESQEKRRTLEKVQKGQVAMSKLTGDDVMNWGSHEFFRNGK